MVPFCPIANPLQTATPTVCFMVYVCAYAVLPHPQTDLTVIHSCESKSRLGHGDGYNHELAWYTPLLVAFLFDSRLTLTNLFTTDIALEGTALASGPFGSDQEAVNHGSVD